MAKIEVFDSEKAKPEPVVRLALSVQEAGSVTLLALDENGEEVPCGHILSVLGNGKVELHGCCEVEGLSLTKDGYVRVEKD